MKILKSGDRYKIQNAKVGLVTQDTCYECVGQPAIADKIKSNFSQIKSPLPLQAEYL